MDSNIITNTTTDLNDPLALTKQSWIVLYNKFIKLYWLFILIEYLQGPFVYFYEHKYIDPYNSSRDEMLDYYVRMIGMIVGSIVCHSTILFFTTTKRMEQNHFRRRFEPYVLGYNRQRVVIIVMCFLYFVTSCFHRKYNFLFFILTWMFVAGRV
jgi:ABC-type xylose transport system permease subunit